MQPYDVHNTCNPLQYLGILH